MSTVVKLSHDYGGGTSPDRLFAVATDWECLRESVRGLITYRNLPDDPLHQGQTVETAFSLFGIMPWQDWTMEVVAFDPSARHVASHEFGGPVRRWDHKMTAVATEEGARLVDEIEIDAGLMTPIYAAWGRFMYARRHEPRLKMLGLK